MGYRDTTPEVAARLAAAVEARLVVVLGVAVSEGASCAP
jgi:hypothetical protein